MSSENDVYDRLSVRNDVWAKQSLKPDEKGKYDYYTQKSPLTRKIIGDSLLSNKITIGVYTVKPGDNTVINPTIDIDNHSGNLDIIPDVVKIYTVLKNAGMFPYIEASAGELKDGAHVGVICKPTLAATAKQSIQKVLDSTGLKHEVNPKQETVEEGKYGNLVKLPFQYHNRTKKRSAIINPETLEPFSQQDAIKYLMTLPDTVFPEIEGIETPIPIIKEATTATTEPIKGDMRLSLGFRQTSTTGTDNTRGVSIEEITPMLNKWMGKDSKLKTLYNGEKLTDYRSRSEAEIALCQKLIFYNFPDEAIGQIMTHAKIGKWKEESKNYREITLKKAKENQKKRIKTPSPEQPILKPTCSGCVYKPRGGAGGCRNILNNKPGTENKKQVVYDTPKCEHYKPPEIKIVEDSQDEEINVPEISQIIMEKFPIITLSDNAEEMYYYENGVYNYGAETKIRKIAQELLGNATRKNAIFEIIYYIQNATFLKRDEINNQTHLINMKNGLYNIRTKALEPHNPKNISTCQIQVNYNPDAECPKIANFLCEVLRPRDIALILQSVGYCFIPDYSIQKALLLNGSGLNGKGALGRLITAMFGKDNVSSESLKALNIDKFSAANLYGKLINIDMDLTNESINEDSMFKKLTGGDMIAAERKFQNRFTFKNTARLFYGCNDIPQHRKENFAYYRRWIIIDFPNKFDGTIEDKNLDATLQTPEELSGFFNLCLDALHWLLETKTYFYNKTPEEVGEEYQIKSNSVMAFMKKCTIPADDIVRTSELYENYIKWGEATKIKKIEAANIFGQLLKAGGYSQVRPYINSKQTQAYEGIVLNQVEIEKTQKETLLKKNQDVYKHWYKKEPDLSKVSRVAPQIILYNILLYCKKNKNITDVDIAVLLDELYLEGNPTYSPFCDKKEEKQTTAEAENLSMGIKPQGANCEIKQPATAEPEKLSRVENENLDSFQAFMLKNYGHMKNPDTKTEMDWRTMQAVNNIKTKFKFTEEKAKMLWQDYCRARCWLFECVAQEEVSA